jgi:hypothetical protein
VLLATGLTGGAVEFTVTLLNEIPHNVNKECVLVPDTIITVWKEGQECESLFRRPVGTHKQLALEFHTSNSIYYLVSHKIDESRKNAVSWDETKSCVVPRR